MFSLREFIKDGLLKAINKMSNHKIIISSIRWLLKGIFTEIDLIDINKELNNSDFNLNDYARLGLLEAIGELANYEIKILSSEWFAEGILTEEDLAEIEAAINDKEESLKINEDLM
jgi:hypothetical protein